MSECRYTYDEFPDHDAPGHQMYPVTDQESGDVVFILTDCTPERAAWILRRINHPPDADALRCSLAFLLPFAESDIQDRVRLGGPSVQEAFTAIAEAKRLLAAPNVAASGTACTGCGYQDDPEDGDSSMCRDCGDCTDCCWENHAGEPHAPQRSRSELHPVLDALERAQGDLMDADGQYSDDGAENPPFQDPGGRVQNCIGVARTLVETGIEAFQFANPSVKG